MTYVTVVAGLVALVFIHELGHFFVARAVGTRPRSFYVGFPPALLKFERKGVEYGLGAIPLGGYVRIPGMNRPSGRDLEFGFRAALEEAPELGRPLQRVVLALDRDDFEGARAAIPELRTAFDATKLPRLASTTARRAIRDAEEGSGTDAYWHQATWRRIAIIAAGPAANILVAFVIFFIVYATGAPSSAATTKVAEVRAGTPAASAGLHPGDRIVAINHRAVNTFDDVSTMIHGSNGRPLLLTVRREGTLVQLRPRAPMASSGSWVFGFMADSVRTVKTLAVGASAKAAALTCWDVVSGTVSAITSRFGGGQSQGAVLSPIGITRAGARALRHSFAEYLEILALVSMSLAILNLLPLLPLDGGHILFALIERIRGRAVAREVYERASVAGFGLLMVLMIIAFSTGNNPQ